MTAFGAAQFREPASRTKLRITFSQVFKMTAFGAAQFREPASRTKLRITFSRVFFFTCEKLSLELPAALWLTVIAREFDMSFIIPVDM